MARKRRPDDLSELEAILQRCRTVCGTQDEELTGRRHSRRVSETKQLFVYCALYKAYWIKKKIKIGRVMGVAPWQVTYYRKKAEFSIKHERWFQRLVQEYTALCASSSGGSGNSG